MRSGDGDLLPREFPGGSLRRLRASDLDAFQAYRRIPELGRYQGWSPMSDAEALAFLVEMSRAPLFATGRWLQLGIAAPRAGTLVGDIGLHLSDDGHTGEVGFTLQPSAQGRGIATSAVHAALGMLFDATAVARVLGITDARNVPSVRVLERLGFACQQQRQIVFKGETCVEWVCALPRPAGSTHPPGTDADRLRGPSA